MSKFMKPIQAILSADDKKYGESKNFITALTRKMMVDYHLNWRKFQPLLESWLVRLYGVDPNTGDKRSTMRSNVLKEITSDTMTSGNFEHFTQLLGGSRVTVSVRVEFDDGRDDLVSSISFINRENSTINALDRPIPRRPDFSRSVDFQHDENYNAEEVQDA